MPGGRSSRDRAGCKTKLDGHAPLLFSFKMVGITSGKAFNQGCFAVVYMACCAKYYVSHDNDYNPIIISDGGTSMILSNCVAELITLLIARPLLWRRFSGSETVSGSS